MLSQFLRENREEIVGRCRARVGRRMAPRPTDLELEHGVPMFLKELELALEAELEHKAEVATGAGLHGSDLLRHGFTIGQVVHDYGDACQAITELAIERAAPISTDEFRALNKCLDNAIADAVTAYEHQHEIELVAADARRSNEQLGCFAHELRNLLSSAVLAYDVLRRGSVGIRGSTGDVLGRSLIALRALVDTSLTDVRLSAGITKTERIAVASFVEELEVAASLAATSSRIEFVVTRVDPEIAVNSDRQILASVISNLLQNAFKFTRPFSRVVLNAHASGDRVLFDVADQCGGLAPGKADHLFEPFEQDGADRSGVGLGLAICARGIAALHGEIRVSNHPGQGCVFTVDLPCSDLEHSGTNLEHTSSA